MCACAKRGRVKAAALRARLQSCKSLEDHDVSTSTRCIHHTHTNTKPETEIIQSTKDRQTPVTPRHNIPHNKQTYATFKLRILLPERRRHKAFALV